MVEHDIITSDLLFTETIKNDLDKRYADYKTGRVKMISAPESKRRIQKILRGNSTA